MAEHYFQIVVRLTGPDADVTRALRDALVAELEDDKVYVDRGDMDSDSYIVGVVEVRPYVNDDGTARVPEFGEN